MKEDKTNDDKIVEMVAYALKARDIPMLIGLSDLLEKRAQFDMKLNEFLKG